MLDLLIGSLSEIKSYVVVLSFYIKMMKQRTFQACSLKHNIKNGMFYVQGELNFFKSGRRESSPPFPPTWLRVCMHLHCHTCELDFDRFKLVRQNNHSYFEGPLIIKVVNGKLKKLLCFETKTEAYILRLVYLIPH